MTIDNESLIFVSKVITAFVDFLLATSVPGSYVLYITALVFLAVRIVLAAFERDLEYNFVSVTNKAVIAAMSADRSNITAAAVSFILESLVYVYFGDGKTPSK